MLQWTVFSYAVVPEWRLLARKRGVGPFVSYYVMGHVSLTHVVLPSPSPPPPLLQVGDRAASFSPGQFHVRRDGSYIYENFLPTGGTDVKVWGGAV